MRKSVFKGRKLAKKFIEECSQKLNIDFKNYKNFKIGCNHLNGFVESSRSGRRFRNTHFIYSKKNFDYLKEIDKSFFSDIICLEMENRIATQLKYKEYLRRMLRNKI